MTNTTNYSNTFTYPNAPCLLPHWQPTNKWCGTDTEELYNKNCELRLPHWIWENRPVEYVWNTEGYRAPEWSTVDWPTTHVVMGCGLVLGVGVNEDETLGRQLSQQLKEPVVNLGYGSGTSQVVMYNTMRMQELGWRPKTVSIVIPELSRMTYFDEHDSVQFSLDQLANVSGSALGIFKMYEYWVKPLPHAELYGRMAIKGAVAIWQAMGVPVIQRHAYTPPGQAVMAPKLGPVQDFGRDLFLGPTGKPHGHPGPLTLAYWARDLADQIRLL